MMQEPRDVSQEEESEFNQSALNYFNLRQEPPPPRDESRAMEDHIVNMQLGRVNYAQPNRTYEEDFEEFETG